MLLEALGDLTWFVWVVYSQSQPGPFFSPAQDVAAGQARGAELIASAGLMPGEVGEPSREKEDAFPAGNPVSQGIPEMQKGKCRRRIHCWWK